ncbi:DUF2783 domain-containing protein [Pseudomonas fluorescens]|uniref:DUF2783 domain-containing protein n=1 Tax=Pseudomonas fluorescens TaxID=294 RepID=UPI0012426257|nr:DUF2783 domain-containing protein [Pseudomonas fluorescens]VVM83057.1 hypothetical protein PS639_02380 [Pseudomonas fluorescens]
MSQSMNVADLERAYDRLAEAIDRTGHDSELFLVKLALLAAEALNDVERFDALIECAVQDL